SPPANQPTSSSSTRIHSTRSATRGRSRPSTCAAKKSAPTARAALTIETSSRAAAAGLVRSKQPRRAQRARRFPFGDLRELRGCLPVLRLDEEQRTLQIREVAGIQDLNAGVVLAVERRDVGRATRILRVDRRVEPETEMKRVHRVGYRVGDRV